MSVVGVTDGTVPVKDLEVSLGHALEEVVTTMLNQQPIVVRAENLHFSPDLSAIVGFGGKISGFLAVHTTSEGACMVASALLGMSFEIVDETVSDAMGELVNVLAGSVKKHASGDQELFKISVPSIICGTQYSTHAPKHAQQLILGIKAGPCSFLVQLVIETAA